LILETVIVDPPLRPGAPPRVQQPPEVCNRVEVPMPLHVIRANNREQRGDQNTGPPDNRPGNDQN